MSSSERGSDEGQFVDCGINPAFSFRNLTPVPLTAQVQGAVSSVSFQLSPGGLFHMCSLITGKSVISFGLCFDGGLRRERERYISIDVLGSKTVHAIDAAVSHSSPTRESGKDHTTTTRLIIERTDGPEHVGFAPYWIVNRSGIPISICSDGKPHEAHIDTSSLPIENMYSALPCDLCELLEKKSASLVMWGFLSIVCC